MRLYTLLLVLSIYRQSAGSYIWRGTANFRHSKTAPRCPLDTPLSSILWRLSFGLTDGAVLVILRDGRARRLCCRNHRVPGTRCTSPGTNQYFVCLPANLQFYNIVVWGVLYSCVPTVTTGTLLTTKARCYSTAEPEYLSDISHYATSSAQDSVCSIEPGTPEDVGTIVRQVTCSKCGNTLMAFSLGSSRSLVPQGRLSG